MGVLGALVGLYIFREIVSPRPRRRRNKKKKKRRNDVLPEWL